MGFEAVYKCDECGKARQEVNHWWVIIHRKDKGQPSIGLRAMQPNESPYFVKGGAPTSVGRVTFTRLP